MASIGADMYQVQDFLDGPGICEVNYNSLVAAMQNPNYVNHFKMMKQRQE